MFSGGSVYELILTHPLTPNVAGDLSKDDDPIWAGVGVARTRNRGSERINQSFRLRRLLAVLRHQLSDAIRRLRALADPVVDASEIELQTLSACRSEIGLK